MTNPIKLKIQNYFNRVYGLVSYYKTQNKELLPVTKNEVLEIPTSEYQFVKYAHVRKQEIDADKNKKKKDTPKGSKPQGANRMQMMQKCLKINHHIEPYSRMHCSFVPKIFLVLTHDEH